MKYQIECCYEDPASKAGKWTEDYDDPDVKSLSDAEIKGRALIEFYNETCRPGERRRKFLAAKIIAEKSDAHKWQKANAVTLLERGLSYDLMRCENCGVTARRYGLGHSPPVIEKKYAKKYQKCPGEFVV
jgi:hypothetical protein